MLYYLHLLTDWFSPLRMFKYITFRALMGAATAFLVSVILGPPLIRYLRQIKMNQQLRDSGGLPSALELDRQLKGTTPTMGGLLIVLAVLVSCALWAVPTNGYILLALGTMCYMGLIGLRDDYLKFTRKNARGLAPRHKLLAQLAWVPVVYLALWLWPDSRLHLQQLSVPFLKEPLIADMGVGCTLIFLALVLVGCTNAVNLTDGLDGLAIGCTGSVALSYLFFAYVTGHLVFAKYLQVPFVAGVGELAVFCGILLGAALGFLWYNCHPAHLFMGDTGSFALGGAIAAVAICVKQEITLVLIGGVFVMEAMSVILQVGYFRLTGGRRLFRCTPIHHHFEMLAKEHAQQEGRNVKVIETMVTVRFWILSIIFALLGVATLKIR